MNSLQQYTTPVAPTTAGNLYVPYLQEADKAIWTFGSGSTRKIIQLSRVRPKPTPTFPGVDRAEIKRTTYYTVNGVEYTVVFTASCSIPVPVASSDRITDWQLFVNTVNTNNTTTDNPFYTAAVSGAMPT